MTKKTCAGSTRLLLAPHGSFGRVNSQSPVSFLHFFLQKLTLVLLEKRKLVLELRRSLLDTVHGSRWGFILYRAALHAVVDGGRDHEARQGGNGVARVRKAMFMLRAFGEREGRLDRDGEDAGCSMKATTAAQRAALRVRRLEQRREVRVLRLPRRTTQGAMGGGGRGRGETKRDWTSGGPDS